MKQAFFMYFNFQESRNTVLSAKPDGDRTLVHHCITSKKRILLRTKMAYF